MPKKIKRFKEQTWRNEFREDFFYCVGDKYMPDGPEWVVMEAYIQNLLDRAMESQAKSIIDCLEVLKVSENYGSLKNAIKYLRQTLSYYG